MMKIINNTGCVVTVFNDSFSSDIAIGDSLVITDEQLYGNFQLCFKYFFVKKSEIEEGWEKSRRSYYYSYSRKLNVPTVTTANLYGINEITLEKSDTTVKGIMFKTMCVRNILLKAGNKAIKGQAVSFCDAKNRKKLLGILFMKLTLLFSITVLLALAAFIGFGTNRATNMLASFFAIRGEDVAAASLSVSLLLFIWGLFTLRIFIKISSYNKI